MTKCVDLEIYKGSTKGFLLTFTENHRAYDVTGISIYFTVKAKMGDADNVAKIDKIITNIADPEEGKVLVDLNEEDTDLTPKNYWYSFGYKDVDENEGELFHGKLTIKKPVRDNRG